MTANAQLEQQILEELKPSWWASNVAIKAMLAEDGKHFDLQEIETATAKMVTAGTIKQDSEGRVAIPSASGN